MVETKKSGVRQLGLFAAVLVAGLGAPMFVNAESTSDVFDRISTLEQQTQDLSRSLSGLSELGLTAPVPSIDVGGSETLLVAQSRDLANANLRIQQLEEQMRVLTGQVEGIQFQMTQVYAQLERMNEDYEFRFQQLEGGASGKTDAVTQPGGDMLTGELPQTQILTNEQSSATVTTGDQALDLGGTDLGTVDLGSNGLNPTDLGGDALGDSRDPLVGTGGSLDPNLNGGQPLVLDLSGGSSITFNNGGGLLSGEGQALSLDFDPGQLVTENDADAQYQAGFTAVMEGDYDFAIAQFEQFVALFPGHPMAPDASNWLGESLIQKGAYEDAAEVLFAGYTQYGSSTRAPDLLLKLGVALNGAGERDTACRTFSEVLKRYPHMGPAFGERVSTEMAQAQC